MEPPPRPARSPRPTGNSSRKEGLDTTLGRYLSATLLLVPAFAALLRGDAPPPDTAPLTKDSPPNGLRPRYPRLAAERPTVVVIDDLHFAPDEGRALFLALALAAPGHRMFVVGTARPGLPEAWTASVTRNDHAYASIFRGLSQGSHLLLADVFRSERLAEELALQIATKSDGNPFFVIEIVRELRAGEFVTQGADGTWVRTHDIGEIQILSSVMDLIRARIAELEEEDRSSTWPRAGVRVRSDAGGRSASGWRCCRRSGASGGSRRRSGLCVRWGGATCLTTTR